MFTVLGKIKIENGRGAIVFSDDLVNLYLWFVKKEYPWFRYKLFTPRYKSHLTLFIEDKHDVKNLDFLKSLNGKKIEVGIDETQLTHAQTRLGAEMFLFQIDCPNVWDLILKSGIKHKYQPNRPHITICSSKHGN